MLTVWTTWNTRDLRYLHKQGPAPKRTLQLCEPHYLDDWGGGYDHVPLKVVNGVSSGSGYAASTLWLKPIRTRYLFSMKQCLAYARTATAGVLGDIKWALGEYDLTQASGLRVDGNSCECSQHTEEYNCKL